MADTKVTALPAAATLAPADVAYVVQGGVSKKTTMADIWAPSVPIASAVTLPLAVADINATGTHDATTYLRGDGAWQTPPTATTVTKRVTRPLAGPGAASGSLLNTTSNYNGRYAVLLPVSPTRYRFRIRNYSAYSGTAGTGPLTITTIGIGTPAVAADPYRWIGAMAATATEVVSSFTLDSGNTGAETTTAWVTSPTINANTFYVVTVGFDNNGNPGTATIYGDLVGGYGRVGVNAATAANCLATPITINGTAVWFDVRIEYEYSTEINAAGRPVVPCGLMIGDSITMGSSYQTTVSSGANLHHENWVGSSELSRGFCVANAGIPQSALTDWIGVTATSHRYLARFDLATSTPDFVVCALGINDIAAGQSFANMKTNTATVVANLRTMFPSTRVHLCTIIPGNFGLPITLTGGTVTNLSASVTVASTAGLSDGLAPVTGTGIPASTSILSVDSATTFTMSANGTATNSSLTITAGEASPYIATAAKEAVRKQYNKWVLEQPLNTGQPVNFDAGLIDPTIPTQGTGYGRYIPDSPHPAIAGYQRMADAVRI